MSYWKDRRVLVTGGTGFIGSHLVRQMIEYGANVSALVRDTDQLSRLAPFRNQLTLLKGDISQPSSLIALRQAAPEVVFHLAAFGVEQPLESIDTAIAVNVQGSSNLVAALIPELEQLKAFVYVGTDFEYGRGAGFRKESDALAPPNYYSASKAAGWFMCNALAQINHLPLIGVRPFLAYGPDQGRRRFIPLVIQAALANQPLRLTEGLQIRDFVYIEDVVDGMLCAAEKPSAVGEMFNIATGSGTSLRTIAQKIFELANASVAPEFGAIPYRQGEIMDLQADVSKATTVLGWTAKTSLDAGLRQTIEWYRANGTLV